ncbi:MAG: 2,3-bisphosphoglycerate-independent phosphoglycerate mutase [Symbiobacteriia bacterium]
MPNTFTPKRRPVMLMVLDGVGLNPRREANALALARTPHLDHYFSHYPFTTLRASGESVGLMEGQMGDSNVGHLNLGAGRIVYQELVRVDKAIATGVLADSPVLAQVAAAARAPGHALHLMGLCSPGGVHSHLDHLLALIDIAAKQGVERIFVHAFLDGRDVPPTSAAPYLEAIENKLREVGRGAIATISGRYYAMDRDKRWDRVEKAYNAIVRSEAEQFPSAAAALQDAYAKGETDEFVIPRVITGAGGRPVGPYHAGDGVLFFNFRADRARQLTRALTQDAFDGFERKGGRVPVEFAGMTMYDESLVGVPRVFEPQFLTNTLGEVVAKAGLRQLRIAETEKYAHVTFFFSGGEEKVFRGEDRILVPSPKVATYDLQPEMSAKTVAAEAVQAIQSGKYDFICLNFANGDMVGHTGVLAAGIKALETIDGVADQVLQAVLAQGGAALIVADHGNCDQMRDYQTGKPHTNHTLYQVPCCLVADDYIGYGLREGGVLADATPTLVDLIGLPKPAEMLRESLIVPPGGHGFPGGLTYDPTKAPADNSAPTYEGAPSQGRI